MAPTAGASRHHDGLGNWSDTEPRLRERRTQTRLEVACTLHDTKGALPDALFDDEALFEVGRVAQSPRGHGSRREGRRRTLRGAHTHWGLEGICTAHDLRQSTNRTPAVGAVRRAAADVAIHRQKYVRIGCALTVRSHRAARAGARCLWVADLHTGGNCQLTGAQDTRRSRKMRFDTKGLRGGGKPLKVRKTGCREGWCEAPCNPPRTTPWVLFSRNFQSGPECLDICMQQGAIERNFWRRGSTRPQKPGGQV